VEPQATLILLITIFQDDLVNDFSTNNTPPSEKISVCAVEFFINHETVASVALHDNLLISFTQKTLLETLAQLQEWPADC
jgi:hypothetical protein